MVEVGVVRSDCCRSGVQAVAVRRMARATAAKGVGVGAGSRGLGMGRGVADMGDGRPGDSMRHIRCLRRGCPGWVRHDA